MHQTLQSAHVFTTACDYIHSAAVTVKSVQIENTGKQKKRTFEADKCEGHINWLFLSVFLFHFTFLRLDVE